VARFKRPQRSDALIAPRSDDGGPFLVSGVTHRQDNLRAAGVGTKHFRLVRQFDNPHDQYAVEVLCDGIHIGFITAKNARRYWRAIGRVEDAGHTLYVHGTINVKRDGGLIAEIDCVWPEDIEV
jgi:hypothetical protein